MIVEIRTPDKLIFSKEAKMIQLPGTQGAFEILKNHAPIVSTLKKGQIKITEINGKTNTIDLPGGGLIESNENKIIILMEA